MSSGRIQRQTPPRTGSSCDCTSAACRSAPSPTVQRRRRAYHEERLRGAVESEEEDVEAVHAEHADGDRSGESAPAVEEEQRGGVGVAERDDERAKLRVRGTRQPNVEETAKEEEAHGISLLVADSAACGFLRVRR